MPYDMVNLYPLVPIDKAVAVFKKTLRSDVKEIKVSTKSTISNIHLLKEPC